MGTFIYDGGPKADLDDRALAHIQFVISAKLRRGEPFGFSWREDMSIGGGRTMVWIHPGSALVFKYSGSRLPSINREWIEALSLVASSPGGLYLVPEPAESAGEERPRVDLGA